MEGEDTLRWGKRQGQLITRGASRAAAQSTRIGSARRGERGKEEEDTAMEEDTVEEAMEAAREDTAMEGARVEDSEELVAGKGEDSEEADLCDCSKHRRQGGGRS